MIFLWPDLLWLLLAVPALVAVYLLLLRRKRKAALRYASLSMVKEAMGARQGIRRHLPPLLLLSALAALLLAVARPAAVVINTPPASPIRQAHSRLTDPDEEQLHLRSALGRYDHEEREEPESRKAGRDPSVPAPGGAEKL